MLPLLPVYWQEFAINASIFALVALSLYVCFIARQYSLAQAGLMGVGAYASAFASISAGLPFAASLAVGGVCGGVTGLILGGLLATRLGEFYLALATLAFNLALIVVIDNIDALGGPLGIVGVPDETTPALALFVLGLAVACVLIIARSRLGRAMRAIHEDEQMAACNGIRVSAVKVTTFTLAGVFAGLAGALQAHDLGIVRPEFFGFSQSVALWVPIVVGGTATVLGPVLGALAYVLLPDVANRALHIDEGWILGALLIGFGIWRPMGLIGIRERDAMQWAGSSVVRLLLAFSRRLVPSRSN